MTRKILILCAWMILCAAAVSAQMVTPVKWSVDSRMTSDTDGEILFSASIEEGWHLYGLSLPDGGPKPTSVTYDRLDGVELVGELTPSVAPIEKVDMVFHLKLNWWEGDVTLVQKFRLTGDKGYALAGTITYQGCNDGSCIPPTREPFDVTSQGYVADAAEEVAAEKQAASVTPVAGASQADDSKWWEPLVFPVSDGT
ncbi:MAG: protein-disulfide reductase DsbD N-terminal domain-containing protein, partial [Paramuribaculum sp.]|nr:protein-disulfide reductase DsbD N-terminal domain-containing protein [Paramuribaculum sp.]